jgi:hypothetical protein
MGHLIQMLTQPMKAIRLILRQTMSPAMGIHEKMSLLAGKLPLDLCLIARTQRPPDIQRQQSRRPATKTTAPHIQKRAAGTSRVVIVNGRKYGEFTHRTYRMLADKTLKTSPFGSEKIA